jgi:uncharacterized protein YgiM (DUF1202 family)
MPEPDPPINLEWDDVAGGIGGSSSDETLDGIIVGPVNTDQNQATTPSREDTFTEARVASYKVGSAVLKKTVDQFAKVRSNQCSGEVTVQTEDTPLNVRSGPSTGNPVISKVAKGSKQNVLLWAPDSKNQSSRWFLLVDDRTKTVKGWVSGEYIDTAGVAYAN